MSTKSEGSARGGGDRGRPAMERDGKRAQDGKDVKKEGAPLAPVPAAPAAPDRPASAEAEPPPPRRRHAGRWIMAILVLALVALGVHRWRARDHEKAGAAAGKGAERPVPVLVSPAALRDVPIYLDGLGSVTAYKTVNVRTLVDGRLVRVDFREGQAVKRGDLLAEVDPRPFTIQLHQAEAALARDEAQLGGAEKNLERYAAVSAERLIPQQQTDDQRALVDQLRGTTQADRAQIENAKLMLDYARITSPIDGVVGVRLVDPGNIVHVSDASGIVVVTQMDPIAVIFTLPQDDLPRVVRQQAKGPLAVQALDRGGEKLLATGTLEVIDNQINQATATMRLKALFANPDRALWPNQFVKARLLVDVRRGALVVPAVAVQRGPDGTFVYVLAPDGRAHERPVTVQSTEGDQAILAGGLAGGAQVVTEGQAQLRDGAKVVVRNGAPPPGAGRGPPAPGPGDPGARAGGKRGARGAGAAGKGAASAAAPGPPP